MNILDNQTQYDELYVSRNLASAIAKISQSFNNEPLLNFDFIIDKQGELFIIKNSKLDKNYIGLNFENFFNALRDRNIYLAKKDDGSNVLAHISLGDNDSFIDFGLSLSHVLLSIPDKKLRNLLVELLLA